MALEASSKSGSCLIGAAPDEEVIAVGGKIQEQSGCTVTTVDRDGCCEVVNATCLTSSGRVHIFGSLKKLQGLLFSLIGVGLLAGAVWRVSVVRGFLERANTAEGVVYDIPHGGSHPLIRFEGAAGEKVEYPQGGLIFGYHVGDRVKVLYESQAPRDTACIDAVGALWFTPLILLWIGLGFALAGWRIL